MRLARIDRDMELRICRMCMRAVTGIGMNEIGQLLTVEIAGARLRS